MSGQYFIKSQLKYLKSLDQHFFDGILGSKELHYNLYQGAQWKDEEYEIIWTMYKICKADNNLEQSMALQRNSGNANELTLRPKSTARTFLTTLGRLHCQMQSKDIWKFARDLRILSMLKYDEAIAFLVETDKPLDKAYICNVRNLVIDILFPFSALASSRFKVLEFSRICLYIPGEEIYSQEIMKNPMKVIEDKIAEKRKKEKIKRDARKARLSHFSKIPEDDEISVLKPEAHECDLVPDVQAYPVKSLVESLIHPNSVGAVNQYLDVVVHRRQARGYSLKL